jgi:hypothetical protein
MLKFTYIKCLTKYMDFENLTKSTYIFHPREERWGKDIELTLEVEFSEEEMEVIARLRLLALEIRSLLLDVEGSGLARSYSTKANSLSIPWADTLQNRAASLRMMARTRDSIDTFFAQGYSAERLEKEGFTQEILKKLKELKDALADFIPGEVSPQQINEG